MLLPGLIGACIAVGTRRAHAARAFSIAVWGTVFAPGAYVILVIAVLGVGTGCLS